MKSKNSSLKKGDKVIITKGPIDKVGFIGEVIFLVENGVMVRLGKNWYSPIQFNHLEKYVKTN